jgi:hypothetical protein
MFMRAHWFGAAIVALAAPLVLAQWGCQSTCSTQADCGAGKYCALTSGACISPQSLGFCQSLPSSCPGASSPVCGCDGKTYLNECLAAKAGFAVASTTPCTGNSCGGINKVTCSDKTTYCHFANGVCGAGSATGTCDPLPTSCASAMPSPVCGCDGKTYDSACEAQLAGVSTAASAACACGGDASAPCKPDKFFCNLALGDCLDANPIGTCQPRPTSCSEVMSPVCGCDGNTYPNVCYAAMQSVSPALMGMCDGG